MKNKPWFHPNSEAKLMDQVKEVYALIIVLIIPETHIVNGY